MNLTHLSFAYDILVFTDGSVRSLLTVMDKFDTIYGFHTNAVKSSIFATGHDVSSFLTKTASLGIKVRSLPVRYIGMPLTIKALSKQDYEPLIDKVRGRMLSWRNKCLTYAGRLQLIKINYLKYD